ncbi:hypothetical protein BD779DRAFT_1558180 [Infundibulicybe gibba]|nr:hypothetical protein BD779DRAFT_1558180 [Infundibulicybe gibba]
MHLNSLLPLPVCSGHATPLCSCSQHRNQRWPSLTGALGSEKISILIFFAAKPHFVMRPSSQHFLEVHPMTVMHPPASPHPTSLMHSRHPRNLFDDGGVTRPFTLVVQELWIIHRNGHSGIELRYIMCSSSPHPQVIYLRLRAIAAHSMPESITYAAIVTTAVHEPRRHILCQVPPCACGQHNMGHAESVGWTCENALYIYAHGPVCGLHTRLAFVRETFCGTNAQTPNHDSVTR